VLIGLLLPAVQKVREAATLLLVDPAGQVAATIPVEGGRPAFFDIQWDRARCDPLLVISERGANNVWRVPSSTGVLIGLLLPAVQPDGSSAGILAGSAQIIGEDGSVGDLLPFTQLGGLVGHTGGVNAGVSFVGPATLAGNTTSLIGLLLPAVQRAREPHRLLLLNSLGDPIASIPLPAPEQQMDTPLFGAQCLVFFAGGSVRVEQVLGDGSVRFVSNGVSPDGILIGLLLPAVQVGDKTVGPIGGSLQIPPDPVLDHHGGGTHIFTDGHAKWIA
jgi:hypothetical protein